MQGVLEATVSVEDMLWILVGYLLVKFTYWQGKRAGIKEGRAHLDGLPVSCVHGDHPDDCAICRH